MADNTHFLKIRLATFLSVILTTFFMTGISSAAVKSGAWSSYPNPTTDYMLRSISMVSESVGWAVGMTIADNGAANGGVLLRWDGSTWKIYSTSGSALYGVTMLSSTDGWAVGQYYSGAPLALHWDGSGWSAVNVPNCSKRLNAVAMTSPTHGWAVGVDCIATWNGTTWATYAQPAAYGFDAITAVSDTEAWAIGYSAMVHINGGFYTITHPVMTDRYYSLSAVSATDIWGAGEIKGEILHYDGVNWSVLTTISGNHMFYGIKMLSATDGWAVGDIIAHWDGSSWSKVSGPYTNYLWAADFKGFSGWAVGYNGNILRYVVDPPYKLFIPVIQN